MSLAFVANRRLLVLCGSVAVVVGLTACGSSGGGTVEKAPKTASSAKVSATPAATNAAGGTTTGTGTTTGGGTGTGTGTATGTGTGGGITLNVSLTGQPACPSGTNNTYFAGNPAVISWTSTGATNVSISVDGPGLYGTFGPNGSQSLPFSCSGMANTTQTHTYTVTTTPGGVSRTITASATVNEVGVDVGSGSGSGGSGGGSTPAPPTATASP